MIRPCALALLAIWTATASAAAQSPNPEARVHFPTILFGAAYYDEYSPDERLDEDVRMMKQAGITVIRIAESTWGTEEPRDGVFDFSHVDRVLNAMDKAGIKVIVGTPTYAIPTWLAREHPEVLAITPAGQNAYGKRQNMDITAPEFRKAAENIIVALVEHVKNHPSVVGYQIDNETKSYDTSGPNVQAAFVRWIRNRFPNLDTFNHEFGLDYWSNRVNDWKDFPSTNGSINASIKSAFAEFQRGLVTEYLTWQADLVRRHDRPDQFITQNFDLDWRGYSYGVQTHVDHFDSAKPLDIAGIDIYHPTQDLLTGTEIAFGGDMARSIRHGQNFLIMETEAQGYPQWTPYPGQLRLQAFSNLANGANMLEYWHWATTTNSFETYWRGLLSQDYKPNPTYLEAATIGADLKRLGPTLVNMHKSNRIAVYVSNNAQTAFNVFKFQDNADESYNDIVRPFYDSLYRMNEEVDFVDPSVTDLTGYKLIIVPALYAASDTELARLNAFVKAGGHVVYGFKSGFSDQNVKVRTTEQPGGIAAAAGVTYSQFTIPQNVSLENDPYHVGAEANQVRWWMELLTPNPGTTVLARYHHPAWGQYAAATRHDYGKGEVTYIGFMPSDAQISAFMEEAVRRAGLWGAAQATQFPLIARSGTLSNGHAVHYLLNYSPVSRSFPYGFAPGQDLLNGKAASVTSSPALGPWGVAIVEENGSH